MKVVYSSMGTHLWATERHLPDGITCGPCQGEGLVSGGR